MTEITTLGTFANDTAILVTNEDPIIASSKRQEHLNLLGRWLTKWKLKINQSKSTHITFTLRRPSCPRVNLNQIHIPQQEVVKYLGTF